MPALPVIGSPLTASHKAELQRSQYLWTRAVEAADRMERIGLDVTAAREQIAAGLELVEAMLREYFPGVS